MKKAKGVKIVALLCLICAFAISCINVFSADIVIDTNKPASLMLAYRDGTVPLVGVTVKIYRVADVNSKKVFTLTGSFKNYPVNVNNLDTAAKMNAAAQTLSAYAAADKIVPYAELKTDRNGIVKLENLRAGLFLAVSENFTSGGVTYKFAPFLVELPEVDENGNLNYTDVIASPKKEEFDPNTPGEKKDFTITKRWYDYGNEDKRPEEITVLILKNGELFKEIILSSENNWTFKWSDYGGINVWQAIEKDVPDGYIFALNVGENTIILNNTYEQEEETTTEKDEPSTSPGGLVTVPSTKPSGTENPSFEETSSSHSYGDDTTSSSTSDKNEKNTSSYTQGTTNSQEKLPQTGQLWWPVPVLAAAGLILFAAGTVISSKEKGKK